MPTTIVIHSSTPGYCLKLPGKRLNLSALLYAKKFRSHGYKSGAITAFKELEKAGLGSLEESKMQIWNGGKNV